MNTNPTSAPEPLDASSREYDDGQGGYARDAWLHQRVLSHVDKDQGGAYAWNPSQYTPVAVVDDQGTSLVFAKT